MPLGLQLLFFILLLGNVYFAVWSYELLIAKQQNYPVWIFINLVMGLLSWFFIYRGMFDKSDTVNRKKEWRRAIN